MKYPAPTWRGLIRAEAPGWFVDRMAHYTDRQKSFLVYGMGLRFLIMAHPSRILLNVTRRCWTS